MQDTRAPIATPARKVKLAGRTISVRDDKPTFWDRVEAGAWEPGVLSAISRHAAPGVQFLDLGAWVGPTTMLAALLGAQCLAVEADPEAARRLRANLDANPGLAEKTRIFERAVSPSPEPVTLAARRKPGDSMSSTLLAQQADTGRLTWRAPAITPAELAALLSPRGQVLIKLDIEGGEFDLLPHMSPLLQRACAPGVATRLLASFHPAILAETGASEERTLEMMDNALAPLSGWRSEEITAQGPRPAKADARRIIQGQQSDAWLFSNAP